MRNLVGVKPVDNGQLKCLVLGVGLGLLVTYCLDAANKCGVAMVTVHIIDANLMAVVISQKDI